MPAFEMRLEGAKELDRKLKRLPVVVARKIVRRALRDGAKLVLSAAKANARSMGGAGPGIQRDTAGRFLSGDVSMGAAIAGALVVRASRRRPGRYGVNVQIGKKKAQRLVYVTKRRRPGTRYFIPAAIEYGHLKPGGKGKVQAIPFMRRAWDARKRVALTTTMRSMRDGVEREAAKR